MEKEVDPQVLAVINEKRLSGPRLTPVEIVSKMGVFDAREKAGEQAWLASGDNVIATVWAEWIRVGHEGRWFCLESLDAQLRAGGGERTANQVQRARDRLALLKRSFDAGTGFRAVLQTNRVAIADLETDRSAKISTRVRDDQEWHVASWDSEKQRAVLVRGAPGWTPTEAELDAAVAAGPVPVQVAAAPAPEEGASADAIQSAAMAYVTRHFGGYGYKPEVVAGQGLGYDIEVSNAKGAVLLRVAVKGVVTRAPAFRLADDERTGAVKEPLWRLLVVSDPMGAAAQHKIYKASEMQQAPGFDLAG